MLSSAVEPIYQHSSCVEGREVGLGVRTLEELATVDLAGGDLESDNMTLEEKKLA